jgi:hypothetical protein
MRVAQAAALEFADAAYGRALGASRWADARAALLAGRERWQYAAARNRFFERNLFGGRPDQAVNVLLQRQADRGKGGALGEGDLRLLLGEPAPEPNTATTLTDICARWPTQLECWVNSSSSITSHDNGGKVFPRCGRLGRTSPYWLLSPASILPVLALDPSPGVKQHAVHPCEIALLSDHRDETVAFHTRILLYLATAAIVTAESI